MNRRWRNGADDCGGSGYFRWVSLVYRSRFPLFFHFSVSFLPLPPVTFSGAVLGAQLAYCMNATNATTTTASTTFVSNTTISTSTTDTSQMTSSQMTTTQGNITSTEQTSTTSPGNMTSTMQGNVTTTESTSTTSPGNMTSTSQMTTAQQGNMTSQVTSTSVASTSTATGSTSSTGATSASTNGTTSSTVSPTTAAPAFIILVFADPLTDAQKQSLISILAALTGLPESAFRIISSRKRASTLEIEVQGAGATSAASTVATTLTSNPNYLTEQDANMPPVESARASETTAPSGGGGTNVLVIVLPVVFGTIALAVIIIVIVLVVRRRRFDSGRGAMASIPMNNAYQNYQSY